MRANRPAVQTLACGLVVLGAVWIGPLPELSRHSFAAHMTMHMAVVAVAMHQSGCPHGSHGSRRLTRWKGSRAASGA